MRRLVQNLFTLGFTMFDCLIHPRSTSLRETSKLRLRLEIVFSQPAPPPQCDSTPRRSLAVGKRLDEPGVPRTEIQSTEQEGVFSFQVSVDGFLHVITQVRNRSGLLFYFKKTSGSTTRQPLLQPKPLLPCSLRDCRLAGISERRHRPSKASGLTLESDGEAATFPSRLMPVSCAVCAMCFLAFSVCLSAKYF